MKWGGEKEWQGKTEELGPTPAPTLAPTPAPTPAPMPFSEEGRALRKAKGKGDQEKGRGYQEQEKGKGNQGKGKGWPPTDDGWCACPNRDLHHRALFPGRWRPGWCHLYGRPWPSVEFVEPKFDVTLTAPLDSSVLAVTAWCV